MKCVRIPTKYDCASPSSGNQNEVICRQKALRDAVLCLGWIRLMVVVFYIILYFFVKAKSTGTFSFILIVMIWIVIPITIISAFLLFLGGIDDKPVALDIAMWVCTLVAAYNTVLGMFGAIYFIRVGTEVIHFILAAVFGFVMVSILTVVCHDFVIMYCYREMLKASLGPRSCSAISVQSCI